MVEIKDLKKYYGDIKAVDGVNFNINDGEITGFLGPNGAGKSTTLKLITGYLKADSGSIFFDNQEIKDDSENNDIRKNIGYLPESNPLYHEMIVYDYLKYIAEIKEIEKDKINISILNVAEKCGITDRLSQTIGTLSKGYKQRVGLAQTMLNDPKILILDEPTVGLDPNQILEIRQLIRELGKEKTVILSSHILQEVQAVCDRIIIINQGKIVADTSKNEILSLVKQKSIVHISLDKEVSEDFFTQIKGFISIRDKQIFYPVNDNKEIFYHSYELEFANDSSNHNDYYIKTFISQEMLKNNIMIFELYIELQKLEDVFYLLTK